MSQMGSGGYASKGICELVYLQLHAKNLTVFSYMRNQWLREVVGDIKTLSGAVVRKCSF
jgi:hypothetical protein